MSFHDAGIFVLSGWLGIDSSSFKMDISFINSENVYRTQVDFYHKYLSNPLATKPISGAVTIIPRPRTLMIDVETDLSAM